MSCNSLLAHVKFIVITDREHPPFWKCREFPNTAWLGNSFLVLLGCPSGRKDLGTTERPWFSMVTYLSDNWKHYRKGSPTNKYFVTLSFVDFYLLERKFKGQASRVSWGNLLWTTVDMLPFYRNYNGSDRPTRLLRSWHLYIWRIIFNSLVVPDTDDIK